jgi:hypothetical protein
MTFSQQDVRLLVDMVRLSRVTLLVAQKGADKSSVLRSAVMPLLSKGRRAAAEIPILFDEWNEPPIPALHAQLRQAAGAAGAPVSDDGPPGTLVEDLNIWQDALDATFLVIFDRFERFLSAPAERAGFAEFEETFVQMANDPTLRANFLLALDERAEPLLTRLRRHIPRLGNALVRLPGDAEVVAQSQPAISRRAVPIAGTAYDASGQPEIAKVERSVPEPGIPTAGERSVPPVPSPPEAPTRSLTLTEPAAAPPERVESGVADERVEAEQPGRATESALGTPAMPPAPLRALPEVRAEAAGREAARRAEPRRGLTRIAWAPLLLVAAAVFFLWPKPAEHGPRVEPMPADSVELPKGAAADSAVKTKPIAPAPPPATEASSGVSKPPESAPPKTPLTSSRTATAPLQQPAQSKAGDKPAPANQTGTKSTQPETPKLESASSAPPPVPAPVASQRPTEAKAEPQPSTAADRTAKQQIAASTPAAAPSRAASEAKPEPEASRARTRREAVPKPEAASKAAPSEAAPKAEATSKAAPSEAAPKAEAASKAAPSERAPKAEASSKAAPSEAAPKPEATPKAARSEAAPGARASTAAPAGPALYILVRNEAQRARAQQLIGPLKERGIDVAGIRVVGRSADAAHIRYYRLADRNEAMRVALALREVGLSAQQLKQMPERDTTLPPRTYELWLP